MQFFSNLNLKNELGAKCHFRAFSEKLEFEVFVYHVALGQKPLQKFRLELPQLRGKWKDHKRRLRGGGLRRTVLKRTQGVALSLFDSAALAALSPFY